MNPPSDCPIKGFRMEDRCRGYVTGNTLMGIDNVLLGGNMIHNQNGEK